MLEVKKVDLLEAFTSVELESIINDYIEKNKNLVIMDIKYNVYEADISPEFLEDDGVTRETRHSALILIGEKL